MKCSHVNSFSAFVLNNMRVIWMLNIITWNNVLTVELQKTIFFPSRLRSKFTESLVMAVELMIVKDKVCHVYNVVDVFVYQGRKNCRDICRLSSNLILKASSHYVVRELWLYLAVTLFLYGTGRLFLIDSVTASSSVLNDVRLLS